MASNINPNNIDGNYPIAGQDNNTQGMRDNFTNIKTNFAFAEAEINALQESTVTKGNTNALQNSLLVDGRLQNFALTKADLSFPANIANAVMVNYESAHYQILPESEANIKLEIENWPAAGTYGALKIQADIANTAHTLSFLTTPPISIENAVGIQGYDATTQTITFASTGTYEFTVSSYENGETITITEDNKLLRPFNNSAEQVANAAAVSLATTASWFSTGSSGETATLAAGVEGQIKTLLMNVDGGGDMVITVANAAWGGSGTMTFDTVGDACTLQYINSKWFCIGNNGVVFA
jgi:hypothetical protein